MTSLQHGARAPNTKAATGTAAAPLAPLPASHARDVAEAFDDFMRAFESFKQANDERLSELETRLGEDAVSADKVDRINAAVDEHKRVLERLVAKAVRPAASGALFGPAGEHRAAFERYVRKGDENGLRRLESKAMSYGSGPDGGFLVPPETETAIAGRLRDLSPIRALASVRQVTGAVLKKPFATTGPDVGWVGETAPRPETNTATLAELSFPTAEIYAMPAATAMLLEDSAVDIDRWITAEVEAAFSEQEGAAFVAGNGVNKPKGFLDYATIAETGWSWGGIGYIATGTSAGLPAADASDVLLETVYALKAGYRQNGNWLMSRKTQAAIRKLKDTDGDYIWKPPATADQKPALMGFAVHEAEDMPAIAADSFSIAFGDFARGYLIVDRRGISVLRDPYSAKPYVLFYTTKRVGGGVQDFDAIKLVKFGVS